MFERPHHQRIAQLLLSFDGQVLRNHSCLFGGGTAVALRFGEFRESVDVDFLVSDTDKYRELRHLIREAGSLAPLLRKNVRNWPLEREIRGDQYGIRTTVLVGTTAIKFEIILEARIQLCQPESEDEICGVACLTLTDMATTKLLAISDRGLDAGVMCRDIIDLAMMDVPTATLTTAYDRAVQAYGKSVGRDLENVIHAFEKRTALLEYCLQALSITTPPALVWQRIKNLRRISVGRNTPE